MVRCHGHADFDDQGSDIVCAAISALTGYLGLACTQVGALPAEVTAAEGEFCLTVKPEAEANSPLFLLLETFQVAVAELETHYQGFVTLHQVNTK